MWCSIPNKAYVDVFTVRYSILVISILTCDNAELFFIISSFVSATCNFIFSLKMLKAFVHKVR